MTELGRHPDAYIRPTPSAGTLGGVARRTREVLLLCEAAGFDVVLVETVGVGQSEVAVADLTDLFCVLVTPGAGDELQGIKRGIMELVDLLVVNKADGDLAPAAGRAAADYEHALHLLRPNRQAWHARVVVTSALEGRGVAELWNAVDRVRAAPSPTRASWPRPASARRWPGCGPSSTRPCGHASGPTRPCASACPPSRRPSRAVSGRWPPPPASCSIRLKRPRGPAGQALARVVEHEPGHGLAADRVERPVGAVAVAAGDARVVQPLDLPAERVARRHIGERRRDARRGRIRAASRPGGRRTPPSTGGSPPRSGRKVPLG